MALEDLIVRSQLIPPRQRKGVLRRPRLETCLAAILQYPLTLVHADTGYGKSTALAALAGLVDRLRWYTITEPDRDPLLFLAHLVCAFEHHERAWCERSLSALEATGHRVTPETLTPLINALTAELDSETVLVLDDYHLVADVAEIAALVERLVDYIPPCLHLVLASRYLPSLNALTRWRVKGQALLLTRADLAFTAEEVEALFREQYGYCLSPSQSESLTADTEGWIIALQMIGHSLQSGTIPNLDAVLHRFPSTLDALFEYLAQDVLARQPAAIQRFLLTTSVLRELEGPACDHLLGVQGSAVTLRRLYEYGLFVVSIGDESYRYQRLFHDFLRAQLDRTPPAGQARSLHSRAADHFRRTGQPEETVYHLLEAQEYDQAAALIEEIGPRLVELGRFDSLSAWMCRLPEAVREAHPALNLLMGDVLRLRASFDEALERYAAAERRFMLQDDRMGRSQALSGQAQVYLDTIRPLKADALLEEALRLLEPQEYRLETAALLDRLAENRLNLGFPDQAQALHHEARLLRAETEPGDIYLEARSMLRTGRLGEGQQLLEQRAEEERGADQSRPQRFHRETLMLLSLIHVLQGHADAAERCAREGIAIGQRLDSAFVEAVGYMRLGHALQLRCSSPWETREFSSYWQARDCYHRAIDQVQPFKVLRTQVEPLWGLCRVYGLAGDVPTAEQYAHRALEIARSAGDEWLCDLVQVTMGAAYAGAGQTEEAAIWLSRAAKGFARVGDVFGRSAAELWQALNAWWLGDSDGAMDHLAHLLPVACQQGFGLLFTQRTFLGLRDDQAAAPLLIEAKARGIEEAYADRLLDSLGLEGIEFHPGYTLWVRTLGPFCVWRDAHPVSAGEWKREKARQVFQFMLTYRGQRFYREQIVERLWPQLTPEAANRDFRVALNALSRALEPDRPRGAPPFFLVRQGDVYELNPAARIMLDVDEFERLTGVDDEDTLRRGLSLYEDDYLPECLYEDWSAPQRQRLRDVYLITAERLARSLLRAKAWDEVITLCEAILARDDCWEAAYRLLMRAHAAAGNRALVQSSYQRCVAALRDGLEIEPSATTKALLEKLS